MKVSVSLPATDLSFLDAYARRLELPSRSAALHDAVRALRDRDLEAAYLEADEEWYGSPDGDAWDATAGDGVEDDRATR